ncbi:MAG: hypothetical protein K0S29_1083 [Gammaproteobacteria bacterium]|nr:hypothetical protein [Gammaproteobacteria bacterium]
MLMAVGHTMAIFIVFFLPLLFILKLVLLLAIIISLCRSLFYASRRCANSLIEIGSLETEGFWAKTYSGSRQRLKIMPDTVVSGLLICLHAKGQNASLLKCLIFSWEISRPQFRSLATALRIKS